MSPRRKVPDGSDIWQRIVESKIWTRNQLTDADLVTALRLPAKEITRGLDWAYEQDLIGYTRSRDGDVMWHRRLPRKAMLRRDLFGKDDYCLDCDGIGYHKEGCIHATSF